MVSAPEYTMILLPYRTTTYPLNALPVIRATAAKYGRSLALGI
jgi:hypothetical protein